jgi:leader peptidase (prepilin peptidase) / N-methyltransferase
MDRQKSACSIDEKRIGGPYQMIILITAIAGLLVGSFLNVCIYRMPIEKSIIMPRSHCVKCNRQIPWYDNIPVISFIALLGKCRFCKGRISPRYAMVEVLTAAVFALLVKQLGLNAVSVIYMFLSCGLIVATFIDIDHQIIPDEITYGGMVLGIILSFAFPQLHGEVNRFFALRSSILGLLLGGASIYAVAWIGTIAFRKKLKEIGEESAMGGGDIKYLAMIGAFLGIKGVILVFFLAPFFGSVVGIIEKLRRKADIIPYGPYLSIATLIVMFWGEAIIRTVFPNLL